VPKEKHAFTIGIREYQVAEVKKHPNYRSLTNPAQNALQMSKFFRKQGYDSVQSNIKDFDDVKEKRGNVTFREDIMPFLDDYILKAQAAKKRTKQMIHFFIYYSGIVVQASDTEEFCGVDSNGDLIPLERYCEALAAFSNVFTVCYIEGVFLKEPKRESHEFTSKYHDSVVIKTNPVSIRATSLALSKQGTKQMNT